MVFLLYLLVCTFSLGLVNLAPLFYVSSTIGDFNAEDILLIALLVLSLPAYLRQRKVLASRQFHLLELAWLVFIVVLAVQSLRSPASSLTQRLVHLRFVQSYLLFFPSVAVLDSMARIRTFAGTGIVFALVGTLLTIAQSLHGLANLFDSPFYDIGVWAGNKGFVGGLARVNLPISNWIAFTILALVAAILLRFRLWHVFLVAPLSITILINFARSLWLGMAAALLGEIVLLLIVRRLSIVRALALCVLFAVCLSTGVALASYVGLEGLRSAMVERITEGVYFFLEGRGTWASRLDVAAAAYELWLTEPLWGIGTAYHEVFGSWIDLGLPAALVSIGIVGLSVEISLLTICAWVGIGTLKQGVRQGAPIVMVVGIALPAFLILLLVYQQWIDPRYCAILAIASALAAVLPVIVALPVSSSPFARRHFTSLTTYDSYAHQ